MPVDSRPAFPAFGIEPRTGNTLSLATQPTPPASGQPSRSPLIFGVDAQRGAPSIAPPPGEMGTSIAPSGVSQSLAFIDGANQESEDRAIALEGHGSTSAQRALPPPPPLMGKPARAAPARATPMAQAADSPKADLKARARQEYAFAEEALERGDVEVADRHALTAVRFDPGSPVYTALQVWTASKMGTELPESVRAFSRILDEHPECEPALYYRGLLLKEAGKDRAALRDFITLVRLNPDHMKGLIEVKLMRNRIPKGG